MSTQILTRADKHTVGAICDREGQVLFEHAAPFGLSPGELFSDRLTPTERRFFAALPSDTDVVCASRRVAFLCLRSPFAGLLWQVVPLRASPAAIRALGDLPDAMGLHCSPAINSAGGIAEAEAITAASVELLALCRGPLPAPAAAPLDETLARLAALPPLCGRRLTAAPGLGFPLDGDRPLILYCLLAFFCRGRDGKPISVAADGPIGLQTILLTTAMPTWLPAGRCGIASLAARLPAVPELAVAARLAARSGIAVEAFADGDGRLCFAMSDRLDPALLGFKQPLPLNAEAREAAEAEWCRLLLAVLQAEE